MNSCSSDNANIFNDVLHGNVSHDSGAPGLMDRVVAVHAGSRGLGFSDPIDRTQCALSWNIVVFEWRSVVAVSLNVGGGSRLIKPAKLYICMHKHYKHDEDGCARPWFRTAKPLGERRYENWITHIYITCTSHFI